MLRALVLTAVMTVTTTASAQPRHQAVPAPGAPTVGNHSAPRAPPPPARLERRDDERDLRVLERLLAEFDTARARRNYREVRRVEEQVKTALRAELAEDRAERHGRWTGADRAGRMLREFERLTGRFDRRSLQAKRALLADAVTLARQELGQRHR